MKKHTAQAKRLLYMIALIFLILDSKTSIEGVNAGISLSLKTVIPALFPTMIITESLIQCGSPPKIPVISDIFTLCKLPVGSEMYYITGLLGGYPIGARLIGQDYSRGTIRSEFAESSLLFCSNAGPAFIFGICANLFAERSAPTALWIIQMLTAFITAVILCPKVTYEQPPTKRKYIKKSTTEIVAGCVKTMGFVCGWIVLFRVVTGFLKKWILWLLPPESSSIILGILELTNGMVSLCEIGNHKIRFLLCSALLAFGGICVVMQTASVVNGLSVKMYLKGKTLQAFISFGFSSIYIFFMEKCNSGILSIFAIFLFAALGTIVITISKKCIAFPSNLIYNKKKELVR